MEKKLIKATLLFVFFSLISLLMFFQPLRELTRFSLGSPYYSHIWLIPFVSLFFLITERKRIFSEVFFSPGAGAVLWVLSVIIFIAGWMNQTSLSANDHTSVVTLSGVLFTHGSFLFAYGGKAYRKALFPLLLLVFMIPIPLFLMDRILDILIAGSSAVTEFLFKTTGTPYIRTGNIFHLPKVTIEVAEVCSGIRSSLALVITMCIAAHMFLRTNWKKLVLIVAVLPLTILKNGVRIVTITLLAEYVDEKFLTDSFLHHSGGIFFFLPSLLLLGLLLWWLRKTEGTRGERLRA